MFLPFREADSCYSFFSALSLLAPLLLNTHNDIDFGAGLKLANLVKRPDKNWLLKQKLNQKKAPIMFCQSMAGPALDGYQVLTGFKTVWDHRHKDKFIFFNGVILWVHALGNSFGTLDHTPAVCNDSAVGIRRHEISRILSRSNVTSVGKQIWRTISVFS